MNPRLAGVIVVTHAASVLPSVAWAALSILLVRKLGDYFVAHTVTVAL